MIHHDDVEPSIQVETWIVARVLLSLQVVVMVEGLVVLVALPYLPVMYVRFRMDFLIVVFSHSLQGLVV